MMNMANKEKMLEFMLDMCGKGMSGEEKSKRKEHMEACFSTMATLKPGFMDMGGDACTPSCCAGMDKEKKND